MGIRLKVTADSILSHSLWWCLECDWFLSEFWQGECKSWTLDSGLDHGLDYGLKYGLNSRLIFKLLAMVASQDLD